MTAQITNAEILREIKALDSKFTPLIKDHEERIKNNEKYINAQIAVADYVSKNGTMAQKEALPARPATDDSAKPNTLAKTITLMFSLFTAIVALITYILQIALNK